MNDERPMGSMAYDRNNVFARILRGELPCTKVYEDEHVLAFRDINPQAPTHIVVIPKGEYVSVDDFSANGVGGRTGGVHAGDRPDREAGGRRRGRLSHPRQSRRGGAPGGAAFPPASVRRPRSRADAAPPALSVGPALSCERAMRPVTGRAAGARSRDPPLPRMTAKK